MRQHVPLLYRALKKVDVHVLGHALRPRPPNT